MDEQVKKDIMYALKMTAKFLRKKDALSLGKLSNWSIHTAGVFQDEDSISIAVLTYALFKIVERYETEKISFDIFVREVEKAADCLGLGNIEAYRENIKQLFSSISATDKKLRFYLQKVVNKARIHRGSYLHAHGLSIARTSELMGLSQWQLMDYVGQTKMPDTERHKLEIPRRLHLVRSLFK